MKASRYLLPLLCMTTPLAWAEEDKFSADAEFGAILTSGNTQSTALKGKLDIKQDLTRWRTNFVAEALYKEDEIERTEGGETIKEDEKTAEKYFLSGQGDYKLNEDYRALFIYASAEQDKFSGYEYQATVAAGYTDQIFKTDKSLLKYSIGPGYAFYESEDVLDTDGTVLTPGESEDSLIIRASINYEHAFSENAKFTQILSTDYATDSDKNTKTRSETALTAKISTDFALKASVTATHNSEAPEDKKSTDTQTAVTLVYSF